MQRGTWDGQYAARERSRPNRKLCLPHAQLTARSKEPSLPQPHADLVRRDEGGEHEGEAGGQVPVLGEQSGRLQQIRVHVPKSVAEALNVVLEIFFLLMLFESPLRYNGVWCIREGGGQTGRWASG